MQPKQQCSCGCSDGLCVRQRQRQLLDREPAWREIARPVNQLPTAGHRDGCIGLIGEARTLRAASRQPPRCALPLWGTDTRQIWSLSGEATAAQGSGSLASPQVGRRILAAGVVRHNFGREEWGARMNRWRCLRALMLGLALTMVAGVGVSGAASQSGPLVPGTVPVAGRYYGHG